MCMFSGLLNCSYFFHLEKRLDVSWSLTVTIMFGDIMMWGSFTVKKVMCVVYFDQLLGAACTQKLVETFFSFSDVFLCFQPCYHWKRSKNSWKKIFDQLLGARSTDKLVEIHNICDDIPSTSSLTCLSFQIFVYIHPAF